MCATCGCSDNVAHTVHDVDTGAHHHHHPHDDDHHAHDHSHDHDHDHAHDHDHDHHHHAHGRHHHDHADHHHDGLTVEARSPRTLQLEQDVLAKNNLLAERNRGWLAGRGVLALNLMSSPGAGKTTLLERTIRELGNEIPVAVIEGDQATQRDAERIRAAGCRAVQITTGTGCHLDAEMIAKGLQILAPPAGAVLMIENVGNLVCPALFDLGEHAKVVIASVTEGEDKPLKYPHMFRAAQLMLLNKIDLLPHLGFDVDRFLAYARQVNPDLPIIEVSATRGDGLATWYGWLRDQRRPSASIG